MPDSLAVRVGARQTLLSHFLFFRWPRPASRLEVMGAPASSRIRAWLVAASLAVLAVIPVPAEDSGAAGSPGARTVPEFLDTSFENASPLWYETEVDGVIQLHLLYDHERNSPNRAACGWRMANPSRTVAVIGRSDVRLDDV